MMNEIQCLTSKAAADGEVAESTAKGAGATFAAAGNWHTDPSDSGPSLDLGVWSLMPWQFTQ